MGVTGLWRLIEPAGKPVPVETLENKVLAVDISIWLHQMVKGYQDAKGAPLPNAHLMGLFQRLCKLLYFRVKPVFVFDGGFPDLKKETIAKRQDNKTKYNSESERIKRELALLLSKKTAISSLLGQQTSPKGSSAGASKIANDDDIFKLPALPAREESETESEDEESSSSSIIDMHSIDIESQNFKSLPVKEKYDMLIELKETRKMNSWGRLHELPKKSDNFSDFQMQRLLKRRKVQECLEETEKEMGDTGMSLNELESLLNEEGIDTKIEALPTRRIASNNTTRFLLINNVKQALADAKMRKENEKQQQLESNKEHKTGDKVIENKTTGKNDELEEDLQKAIKMSLECVDDTSAYNSKTDDSWTSYLSDSENSSYHDSEEEDGFSQPDMSSAKAYIMQYSDFTHSAINKIVGSKKSNKNKEKSLNVDHIIDELNQEKSVIIDEVEISSDDEKLEKSFVHFNDRESNPIHVKNDIKDNINSSINTVQNIEQDMDSFKNNTLHNNNVKPTPVVFENLVSSDNIVLDKIPQEKKIFCNDKFVNNNESVNSTQSSVVFINNIKQDVISLDTSSEEISDANAQKTVKSETDSSDDEFEDVPEIESNSKKSVVQLTLKMGQEPDDDDIFADVFNCKESSIKQDIEGKPKAMPINEVGIIKNDFINITKKINEEKVINSKKNQEEFEEIEFTKSNINIKNVIEIENNQGKVEEAKITKPNENKVNITKESAIIKETSEVKTDNQVLIDKVICSSNNIKDKLENKEEPLNTEKLNYMVNDMENEEKDLLQEKGRLDKIGRNITEQMTKEAQQLLQIFGIPYIIAPMEAEAQCAFLESVNLTDGTITDDSDIWLFGGRTVYKNFFNQKKHVLQFVSERIEKSFNLSREQLVLLAMLVGSDYTTGLTGVGPVTALEILASFPYNKRQLLKESTKCGRYQQIIAGLQEFKKWVRAGKRTDNTSLKKKLKNVEVTDDFPSIRVVQAYLDPNVEKSEEKFTWGELDITILRDYVKAKFGWSQSKLDEIIKPVLKRLQDRKSQKNIHDYFKKKVEFQSLEDQMSKRVKAAVQKMNPELPQESSTTEIDSTTGRKRKTKNTKSNVNIMENISKTRNTSGPSKAKQKKTEESVLNDLGVKVVSKVEDGKSTIEITIPKSDRVQEIIPQREKDKQSLLQNKMKAIEIYRKSKLDRKTKTTKRRVILPKEKAELSDSDSD